LELFNLEKSRLWGDLTADFEYPKEACKKDGDKLLAGPVVIGQVVMVLH